MKILFLATDAYGGHGGIAYYNRFLAEALAAMPEVSEIVVLARVARFKNAIVPPKVLFLSRALGSKFRYLLTMLDQLNQEFDLVICGHINLLPPAVVFAELKRIPLVLQVHGIDVWSPPTSPAIRTAMGRVRHIWSVSRLTRDRMNAWARKSIDAYTIIPNALDVSSYGLAPRRAELLERYGLQGRTVMLTLARLSSSERYKGIDEILELLPALIHQIHNLSYVIVGDGDDMQRLKEKAHRLGVSDRVIFTGYVTESEKADHLRLADVFVLTGRGEGFGIVYLEALACAVPVVGSSADASGEALRNGLLGELADPDSPESIARAILKALDRSRCVPEGLEYFSRENFNLRIAEAVRRVAVFKRISNND